MVEGLACLLTETSDAGSSPPSAQEIFFNDIQWQNNAVKYN